MYLQQACSKHRVQSVTDGYTQTTAPVISRLSAALCRLTSKFCTGRLLSKLWAVLTRTATLLHLRVIKRWKVL